MRRALRGRETRTKPEAAPVFRNPIINLKRYAEIGPHGPAIRIMKKHVFRNSTVHILNICDSSSNRQGNYLAFCLYNVCQSKWHNFRLYNTCLRKRNTQLKSKVPIIFKSKTSLIKFHNTSTYKLQDVIAKPEVPK